MAGQNGTFTVVEAAQPQPLSVLWTGTHPTSSDGLCRESRQFQCEYGLCFFSGTGLELCCNLEQPGNKERSELIAANGKNAIAFTLAGGTISSGQCVQVTIIVSDAPCPVAAVFGFIPDSARSSPFRD